MQQLLDEELRYSIKCKRFRVIRSSNTRFRSVDTPLSPQSPSAPGSQIAPRMDLEWVRVSSSPTHLTTRYFLYGHAVLTAAVDTGGPSHKTAVPMHTQELHRYIQTLIAQGAAIESRLAGKSVSLAVASEDALLSHFAPLEFDESIEPVVPWLVHLAHNRSRRTSRSRSHPTLETHTAVAILFALTNNESLGGLWRSDMDTWSLAATTLLTTLLHACGNDDQSRVLPSRHGRVTRERWTRALALLALSRLVLVSTVHVSSKAGRWSEKRSCRYVTERTEASEKLETLANVLGEASRHDRSQGTRVWATIALYTLTAHVPGRVVELPTVSGELIDAAMSMFPLVPDNFLCG